MCLAVPAKIITKDNLQAIVDVSGARREVSLILLPADATVGEYVLVHAGFAIQKVDQKAAEESLSLMLQYAEMLAAQEEE